MVDFNQMKTFSEDPLILVEGAGIRVFDDAGKSYIDGLSGVFAVSLGHSATTVMDAVADQVRRLAFASPIMTTNIRALELVGELINITGGRMQMVKLLNSGSEATEAAFKLSRQYHKQSKQESRYKIISLYQSYHGDTLGALSATGWPRLRSPYEPLASGFLHVRPPICGNLKPHDHAVCSADAAEELCRVIEHEGADTVAAVVVEPVMLTAGVHQLPVSYLSELRRICDETGVLLIFDELVTGFGRLGHWFAAERFDVWPDIVCVGKGISSGYAPLAAVMMTEKVGQAFWGEPQDNLQYFGGHTHAANPVSAAAGLATIRTMREDNVFANVHASGEHLAERLSQLSERHDVIGAVRSIGLLAAVEFMRDRDQGIPFPDSVPVGSLVQRTARQRGLLVRASRQINTFAPPLVTTIDEIDEMVDIYETALDEVCDLINSPDALDTAVGFGI